MFKANPPETDPTSNDPELESQKTKEAAERALDYYLCTKIPKYFPPKTRPIYQIDPTLDDETLLVEASESAVVGQCHGWQYRQLGERSGAQTAAGAATADHVERAAGQSTVGQASFAAVIGGTGD
jgi:hypothetical protein